MLILQLLWQFFIISYKDHATLCVNNDCIRLGELLDFPSNGVCHCCIRHAEKLLSANIPGNETPRSSWWVNHFAWHNKLGRMLVCMLDMANNEQWPSPRCKIAINYPSVSPMQCQGIQVWHAYEPQVLYYNCALSVCQHYLSWASEGAVNDPS